MTLDFVQENFTIGQKSPDLSPQFIFYKRGFRLNGSGGSTPEWQDIILSGNGSLTLTNAKANGLNYVKLFGGTSQRNLPEGYTQYEYLQSSGTQYINTGTPVKANTYVRAEFEFTNSTPSTRRLFGKVAGAVTAAINYRELYGFYWFQSNSLTSTSSGKCVIEYKSDGNVYLDGTVIGTRGTFSQGSNLPMYLFAELSDNSAINYGSVKVYRFTISEDTTVVLDLIPCKRNSDDVLGMYDLVSGQFLTNQGTGDFIAGAVATPTPDMPMNIVSNNGVLKVRQNLWKENYTDLGYLDSTGVVIPTAGYMASDFIEIDQSKKYTFYEQVLSNYTGNGMRICFYNSNKQMVGERQGGAAIDIGSYAYITTPPANAKYIRVSTGVSTGYVTDTTLVEGEYNTTTIQGVVGSIYADGTTETVSIHTKNLFSGTVEQGGLGDGSGAETTSSVRIRSTSVPVKPNTQYNLSWATNSEMAVNIRNAYFYNASNTWISRINASVFTTPPNTAFVRFVWQHSDANTDIAPSDISNVQLELGSTATDYVPYYYGGTATAEMLLAISSYKDVQSVLDGEVSRSVGIKVLDGTEDWVKASGYTNLFYAPLSGAYYNDTSAERIAVPCTHFVGTDATNVNMEDNSIKLTAQGQALTSPLIYIKASVSENNLTTWQNWLATQYQNGQPVIIVFPLKTATTETVTAQPLTIQAGTNIVEITQASIDNLELEVSYKGKEGG